MLGLLTDTQAGVPGKGSALANLTDEEVKKVKQFLQRNAPTVKELLLLQTEQPATEVDRTKPSRLYSIACARSGDKGTGANIGVVARNDEAWRILQTWLTAERVAEYFAPMQPDVVERFELPNLGALNFIFGGVLKRNLRTDAQGKALGQVLLEMPLPESCEAVK